MIISQKKLDSGIVLLLHKDGALIIFPMQIWTLFNRERESLISHGEDDILIPEIIGGPGATFLKIDINIKEIDESSAKFTHPFAKGDYSETFLELEKWVCKTFPIEEDPIKTIFFHMQLQYEAEKMRQFASKSK